MSDSKVLPSSFSKDSFEDSESDEELHSSQDSSEHGAGNTPMMSLFANYYGIEDPAVNNDSSTMDSNRTIDDNKFDADSFVKVCVPKLWEIANRINYLCSESTYI